MDDIDYSIVGQEEPVVDTEPTVSVKFDVKKRVLDTVVEFTVQLIGPNREDLGTRVVQKDIASLNVDDIDKEVRKIGRQAARAMYESDDFQTKLKLAPILEEEEKKKKDTTVDMTEVTEKTDNIMTKQETLRDAVEAIDTKHDELSTKVDALIVTAHDMARILAETNANQVTLSEWLVQIHTILTK